MKNTLMASIILVSGLGIATPAIAQRTCSYTITQRWVGTCQETMSGETLVIRTSNQKTVRTQYNRSALYDCPTKNGYHYYPALVDDKPGCEVGKGAGFYEAFKLDGSFIIRINY